MFCRLMYFMVFFCLYSKCGSQTIKKCSCAKDEVRSSEGCVKKSPQFVQVWNNSASKEEAIDISKHDSVVVQSLVCPDNLIKEIVNEWAFISQEGKLMKYPHPETLHYCIENLLDNNGKLSQKIEFCISKIKIKLCCETNQYMNSLGLCTPFPTDRIMKKAWKFIRNFDHMVNMVSCDVNTTSRELLNLDDPISEYNYLFSLYYQTFADFCIGMYGDENELYAGVTYCSALANNNQSQISIPNIPHCCLDYQALNMENFTCFNHTTTFNFPQNIKWPSEGVIQTSSVMNCSHLSVIEFDDETGYYFSNNGSLHSDLGTIIPFHEYCLGAVVSANQTLHSGLICLHDDGEVPCKWRWTIYRIGLILSTLFVFATLLVYLGVPELRRRIGGLCLISELISLMVSQVTLLILQSSIKFSKSGCVALGVVEIIFLLSSFFWLNIMCFDVWSTFRVFRPFCEKSYSKSRFVKYSLYGWGIPLIVGVIAVALERTDSYLKPGFDPDRRCFFDDSSLGVHWFYLYGIILVLTLANMGFFVHLAATLWSNKREQKKHFRGESCKIKDKQNNDIENLKLCGKLFIVMGLPWLIEVFTSFASQETLCYIWFLDLLNLARGVLIFLIFVVKKSIRDMILKHWCPSIRATPESSSSQPSRKTSTISISQWLPSFHGRKISKVSMQSGRINLEAVKEEHDRSNSTPQNPTNLNVIEETTAQ